MLVTPANLKEEGISNLKQQLKFKNQLIKQYEKEMKLLREKMNVSPSGKKDITELGHRCDLVNKLFQHSNEAIALLDNTFNFKLTNHAFNKIFLNIFAINISAEMNLHNVPFECEELKNKIIKACEDNLSGYERNIIFKNTHLGEEYCYELKIDSFFNSYTGSKELILYLSDLNDDKLQEITERKQQAEIERIGRFNIIGELSSALAHEINQPLTAIKAYGMSCLLKIKKQHSENDLLYPLEQIVKQAEHAGEIIHRMKNFMRHGTLYLEEVDVNSLIKKTMSFLYYELNNFKLIINFNLEDNLPSVFVDRIKIMQVILNLGRNSIEALQLAEEEKPEIIIETYLSEQQVAINFRDNGPGIPSFIQDKIINSYVTTKPQGTGLGLSICRSIIKAHGGTLKVKTDVKNGACFIFTLPAMQQGNDVCD